MWGLIAAMFFYCLSYAFFIEKVAAQYFIVQRHNRHINIIALAEFFIPVNVNQFKTKIHFPLQPDQGGHHLITQMAAHAMIHG